MTQFDYLVVGAGLAGVTLAHQLSKAGYSVLVIDKRDHIGGNCFDYYDKHGVLVHKYGPHYFRTSYPDVKDFLSQFTSWQPHTYKVRVSIDNTLYSFPINRTTLNQFFKVNLKTAAQAKKFLDTKKLDIADPQNAEEQVLALAGPEIYQAFFRGYTQKQWGMSPTKLDASVTARIPIRTNTDDRYSGASFQAMPKHGYTNMFKNMLADIPVMLNTDFDTVKKYISYKKLIYTGPIDAYFDYKYGKLPYRSLKFVFKTFKQEYYQDWGQINYPNDHKYTRIVEIKHVTGQKSPFTTISVEYPQKKGDPYYPVPNPRNELQYQKYFQQAQKNNNVYFIGRLAEYRYLNMDQVIKKALDLSKQILNEKK